MTSIATTVAQDGQLPVMRRQLFVASVALLVAGVLLGVSTNLVKVAHNIGLAPLPFLTWSLAGIHLTCSSNRHTFEPVAHRPKTWGFGERLPVPRMSIAKPLRKEHLRWFP